MFNSAFRMLSASRFNPLSLSPALWLDAADANTLFSGASLAAPDGAISEWRDKSGNSRHATQATGVSQPLRKTAIKNGRDVVRFDGANDLLATAENMPNLQNFTYYVVEQHFGFGGGNFGRFVEIGNNLRPFLVNNNLGVSNYRSIAGGIRDSLVSTATINTFRAVGIIWNTPLTSGADGTIYINGTASNGATTDAAAPASTLNASAQIGNRSSDLGRAFDGDIAELLIIPRALTQPERFALETYLNDKWAIY